MRLRFLFTLFLLTFASEGFAQYFDMRRGNGLYGEGNYAASKVYYDKIVSEEATLDNKKEALFNSGNALYKMGKFDDAQKLFEPLATSDTLSTALRSQAYFNMGNGYFKKAQAAPQEKDMWLQLAVKNYKDALKLNPDDREAKQNYEFARASLKRENQKKQQDKNQQQQDQQDEEDEEIIPSEFAKMLKKQAEELVRQRNYSGAQSLMEQGLQKDKTVARYKGFISRIKTVNQSF
jgi:Ca-activated chloride channel homolog